MSNFKKNVLYALLIAIFTQPLTFSAEQPSAQDKKILRASEELIKEAYTFLNQLTFIFGELSVFIQNDSRKKDETKKAIQKEVLNSRKLILEIARNLDNHPTIAQLKLTLELANLILTTFHKALKSNIEHYVTPEIQLETPRSTSIDNLPCEEELLLELKKSKKTLEAIQRLTERTGLYWYNHLYRNTLDRFIIQPCEKYNLHWKAFYSLAAAAGVAYIWFHANKSTHGVAPIDLIPTNNSLSPEDLAQDTKIQDYLKKDAEVAKTETLAWQLHRKINGLIRSWFGWPVVSDKNTMTDNATETHRIGMFGQAEKALWDAKIGYWSIGALCYQPMREFIVGKYNDATKYLSDKFSAIHSWCKGGAYYQRYKNKTGEFGRIEPRYTFDDIIGFDHAKEILGNIIKYMKNPETYDRAGLTPAKGYLLIGPPRTGKTMLAEAVAGEIKRALGASKKQLPFYPIEARWIAKQGNFDMLIQIMKENAPCIIFIDEIDMLNLHRDKHADKNILLSEFLSTLSGCMNSDPDKQVIIIAATNSPENLDKALRARFGCIIPFSYPSLIDRAEFFARALEGRGIPFEQFDIKRLAELTENCSFELLHKVINHAQFSIRDQGRPIVQDDLERSLNTEAFGIMYQNQSDLPQHEQAILAVHMAGHAIAYTVTAGNNLRMSQVTVRPVSTTKLPKDPILLEMFKEEMIPHIIHGHIFTYHRADSLKFLSSQEIERLCMIELAGHVAEEFIMGTHHTTKDSCSHHDRSRAFYWARKHELNGLNENLINSSPSMQDEINRKAHEFMKACEQKIKELLSSRIELIKLVAQLLMEVGSLNAMDMEELIKLHGMLDGKTIEEFVAENEKKAKSAQANKSELESIGIQDIPVVIPAEKKDNKITLTPEEEALIQEAMKDLK